MSEEPPPGAQALTIHKQLDPLSWDDLDRRNQRRVAMLVSQLMELEAGFRHSWQIFQKAPQLSTHSTALWP